MVIYLFFMNPPFYNFRGLQGHNVLVFKAQN